MQAMRENHRNLRQLANRNMSIRPAFRRLDLKGVDNETL
jgi:hypothetical protein